MLLHDTHPIEPLRTCPRRIEKEIRGAVALNRRTKIEPSIRVEGVLPLNLVGLVGVGSPTEFDGRPNG